jgi:hypothetical protein
MYLSIALLQNVGTLPVFACTTFILV